MPAIRLTTFFQAKTSIRMIVFLGVTLYAGFANGQTKDQEQELGRVGSDPNHRSGQLPFFFERENTHGTRFLSSYWLEGVLELADHRKIPAPGNYLYFNYDKVNSRLVITSDADSTWSYPNDSIVGFSLADSSSIYTFERVPWISRKIFLQLLLKSANGYSLYKRLLTKFIAADYRNEGYYSTGLKYDQYIDSYEYYIIFPGNKAYRKFYLQKDAVRKVLKRTSASLDALLPSGDTRLTEQKLVDIIQYINDNMPG